MYPFVKSGATAKFHLKRRIKKPEFLTIVVHCANFRHNNRFFSADVSLPKKGFPVRIISGSAKGKRLAAFPGGTIRPTPDRVREAIFSILYSRVGSLEGKKVLDLFAGTGAMALEALSRGCRRAVLVDQSHQAARIIPANLKTCGFEEQATTYIRADVLQILPRLKHDGPFDLIFLDPPYGRDLVPMIVKSLFDLELLAPGGIVCAESARDDAVPETIGELARVDVRHYGSTSIHLFTRPEPEA